MAYSNASLMLVAVLGGLVGAVAVKSAEWISSPPGEVAAREGNILPAGGLADRINRLEQLVSSNQADIQRLARSLDKAIPVEPTPEQAAAMRARQEHALRMQNDPDYASQQEILRLQQLEADYQLEPVSPEWSARAADLVSDSIAYASEVAGASLNSQTVDCRSTRCRIHLEMPVSASYEDLVMALQTEIAEALPQSKLVVLPPVNGIRQVHIFAQGATQSELPAGD